MCRRFAKWRAATAFALRTAPGTDDAGRTVVRIDRRRRQRPLIQTSVSGRLQPATASHPPPGAVGYPAMTLASSPASTGTRLLLWLKRVFPSQA